VVSSSWRRLTGCRFTWRFGCQNDYVDNSGVVWDARRLLSGFCGVLVAGACGDIFWFGKGDMRVFCWLVFGTFVV